MKRWATIVHELYERYTDKIENAATDEEQERLAFGFQTVVDTVNSESLARIATSLEKLANVNLDVNEGFYK